MRRLLSSLFVLTVACALGDYSGGTGNLQTGGGGNPDGGLVAGDIPCDVAAVLNSYCESCHGATPTGGAPMSLNSLAALTAAASGYPGQNNAQRSLVRMQDAANPMPPGTGVTVPAASITAFGNWVDAGTPAGSCGTAGGNDPFSAPHVCTSGQHWNGRDGRDMRPGEACVACHIGNNDGPSWLVGGTVYQTGHDPNDCNGANVAAVVTVTDKNGSSQSVTVNVASSAGNFFMPTSSSWPVFPITATVTYQGKTRSMVTQVPSGDCNSCHTENGTSNAPGRVALP